ncbi:MAG: DUF1841 family protein [Burkholderiaceae bacterium]
MFNPSVDDVRRFFCETWRKHRAGGVLTPLEAMAADAIAAHPDYHEELADLEAALARNYAVEDGRTNPFLHLSMHLAIAEQVQVDQPHGIRAAYLQLAARHGNEHDAMHDVMEALSRVVWEAQRAAAPLGAEEMSGRYIDALKARASRD